MNKYHTLTQEDICFLKPNETNKLFTWTKGLTKPKDKECVALAFFNEDEVKKHKFKC